MARSEARDWSEEAETLSLKTEGDRQRTRTDDAAWGYSSGKEIPAEDAADISEVTPSEPRSSDITDLNSKHEERSEALGGLTEKDRKAIADYTGIEYRRLNDTLRTGTLQQLEGVADNASDLSEALRKLPDYEGTVQRGGHVPESIVDRYREGEVVVENGYTSATTDPEKEFGGNALWVIESKHGRDISELSGMPEERELLFDHFSSFRVLSKERDPDLDRWIIYMEES